MKETLKSKLLAICNNLPYPCFRGNKYINNINITFFGEEAVKRGYVIKKDIDNYIKKTNKYLNILNEIDGYINMLSDNDIENIFIKEKIRLIRMSILLSQNSVYAEANKGGYVSDNDSKEYFQYINNTVGLYSKYIYGDSISSKNYDLYVKILLYIYYKGKENGIYTEEEAKDFYELLTKKFNNIDKYDYNHIIDFFNKKENKKYVEKFFEEKKIDNNITDAFGLKKAFEFVVKEIYGLNDIQVDIDEYKNFISIFNTRIVLPSTGRYTFTRVFSLISHEIEGHYLRHINHNYDIKGDTLDIEEGYAIFNERMMFANNINDLDETVGIAHLILFIAENCNKEDTHKLVRYINKIPYLYRYSTDKQIEKSINRKKTYNFFQAPGGNQRDKTYYEGYQKMINIVKEDYTKYFKLSEGCINTQHFKFYKPKKNVVYNMWIGKILYKLYTEKLSKEEMKKFINDFVLIKNKKKVIDKLDKIYELYEKINRNKI